MRSSSITAETVFLSEMPENQDFINGLPSIKNILDQPFVKRTGEHYVVIDNEIVWYGSVNLLSKEDAADNLMRVFSKDIAVEHLAMTFCSETELQEW